MVDTKEIDCTADDFLDEIHEWREKKQKVLHNIAEHEQKEQTLREEQKIKFEEEQLVLVKWKEAPEQKEWFEGMTKKIHNLTDELDTIRDDIKVMHKEGSTLKKMISSQLETTFRDTIQNTPNLVFIKDVIQQNSGLLTVCGECSLDLSPLLYTPKVIKALSSNCMECGLFLCNTCVISKLHINGLNTNSIGYQCSRCNFFNCNTVKVHRASIGQEIEMSHDIVEFNPISSGVSTSVSPHRHGRVLKTSNPDMSVPSHKMNVSLQVEFNNYHKNNGTCIEDDNK